MNTQARTISERLAERLRDRTPDPCQCGHPRCSINIQRVADIELLAEWDAQSSPAPKPVARDGWVMVPREVDAREKAASDVYTCILRGLNDLMVSHAAENHISDWLQSWAQLMRNAGYEPNAAGKDIDRALMVLAAPPEDIK